MDAENTVPADRPDGNQTRDWFESIQAEAERLRTILADFTMRIRPKFEDPLSDEFGRE